jgi:two-component system response regulator FixJ
MNGAAQVTEPAAPDPRILLVEDDAGVRRSLQFSLALEAFRVEAYESASALLGRGDLTTPGCLIIDYHLPDLNGLDLLDALRARGVILPAVLITSHPKGSVCLRAAAAGVEIVEKPLMCDALAIAVRKALSSA